jgi:hypothetical protein
VDYDPYVILVVWPCQFAAFLRRNLLLIIAAAVLVMQIVIWQQLERIWQAIPTPEYEGPRCTIAEPCHVIINRP